VVNVRFVVSERRWFFQMRWSDGITDDARPIRLLMTGHLRRLLQIRRRACSEVTVRLVQAFIISRLDYCNSVQAALPESTIQPLQQRVQNAAARLIFGIYIYI